MPKAMPPIPPTPPPPASPPPPKTAEVKDYVREAFLFRWNLLFFLGGVTAAAIAPVASVALPLVLAAELSYLTGLISMPRFRSAIDAKVHAQAANNAAAGAGASPAVSIDAILDTLPTDDQARFRKLKSRCLDMRKIAAGVRGATRESEGSESLRTSGLDRLLWLFLRLLVSRTALDRFLATMSEKDVSDRLAQLRKDLSPAQTAGDDRVVRSLQDSIAMSELRLDNYARAKKNAQFVALELDRIEGKIQALSEMAVNRQDPDFLSSQADSAAESMRQTEKAVTELQHLTGLADELQEPPSILESDQRVVQRQ